MKSASKFDRAFIALTALFSIAAVIGVDYTTLNDPFRDGKMRYLLLAFATCSTWLFFRIANPAWALFAGYAFVWWVIGDFQAYGVIDITAIPACLCVGEAISRGFKRSDVARTIAALGAFTAALCVLQILKADPFFDLDESFVGKPVGTFGHYTMVGVFTALGAMYFLQRVQSAWGVIGFLALAGCTFATGSTMSIVAFGAGALYCLWRRERLVAEVTAGVVACALILARALFPGAEFFSFTGRLSIWPIAANAWLEAPIFGHGPGSWLGKNALLGAPQEPMQWLQVHNDFLQLLVEYGLVGFALVIAGLVIFYRNVQRLCPVYGGMATILAVNALGNFPMHMACFGIIAGWLAATAQPEPKAKT